MMDNAKNINFFRMFMNTIHLWLNSIHSVAELIRKQYFNIRIDLRLFIKSFDLKNKSRAVDPRFFLSLVESTV